MASSTPGPQKIILLKEYHQEALFASIDELECPICGNPVKYHAFYWKWLYVIQIKIQRVKCQNENCGRTHALIPADSVPGASTGLKELNLFIKMKNDGSSVEEAGQCFVDAGMNPDYPEEIHKRLKRYEEKIKVVFGSHFGSLVYWKLILRIAIDKAFPASSLNELSYSRHCNPVLFSRRNILHFPMIIVGARFSHDMTSQHPP